MSPLLDSLAMVCSSLCLVAGIGCAVEEDPATPDACAAPARVIGGACVPPGTQDDGCPPGTLGLDDGSCLRAGIGPTMCAEGFAHDGDVGCLATLPSEACGPGLMAVPGDEGCRAVMGCGSGPWGDIPIDATTQHVDAAYAGGDSDGSAAKPWTTIGAAYTAAAAGELIAVAEGSYNEDVEISKPVRLWGVCPERAEVRGTGATIAAIVLLPGSTGSEVHGLGIRGPSMGIASSGAQQLLVDQVWIHDSGSLGLNVQEELGPAALTLRDSLIEGAHDLGVLVWGSAVAVERSVVRDTQTGSLGARGIYLQTYDPSGARPILTLGQSVVERNLEVGLLVEGGDLVMDGSVIRDTFPAPDGSFGRALELMAYADSTASTATVTRSLFERNHSSGVLVAGSQATFDAVVIRDTSPDANGVDGIGLQVIEADWGGVVAVSLKHSLVERNHAQGIHVDSSAVDLESVVVRDTMPGSSGKYGRGLNVQSDTTRAYAYVRGSRLERNAEVGLLARGADVIMEGSSIATTSANALERFGDGVSAFLSNVSLTACDVSDSTRAGVSNFAGSVTLGNVAIRCAAFDLQGDDWNGQTFSYDDRGGNGCGCSSADGACIAVSEKLEPPTPFEASN